MKIQRELISLRSDKPHRLQSLKTIVFRRHGETLEQFYEQPKGKEYLKTFQHYKDILTILNTWFTKSGIVGGVRVTMPCINSRSNLTMLSKNINGVAYGQVEISAALATSRTAPQMTCRFRDIEKNVRLISVINIGGYYPKLLPSQLRHSKASDTLWFKKLQQR